MRGTTPTLTFNLPFEASFIKKAYITLKCGEITIEKKLDDCKTEEKSITATLTQEETLQLPKKSRAKVQLRVVTEGEDALKSDIYYVNTGELLKEGVI